MSDTGAIRVVVADDQRVVREGIALIVDRIADVDVVGTAADGNEAIARVDELIPDIVIMDIRMPYCDGIEATKQIRAAHPRTNVIVLTTFADDELVFAALKAGARGYLTKDADGDDIEAAIEAVGRGTAQLDPLVQAKLVDALSTPDRAQRHSDTIELPDGLTTREAEVLRLIAGGLTNTEIADTLYVSDATVKSHINHIFAKTHVRDRAQAVIYAYRTGIAALD